jgi:hypothetical protein
MFVLAWASVHGGVGNGSRWTFIMVNEFEFRLQADAHVFDWALAQVAEDDEDDEDDLVLLALADALGVTIDRFADV